MDSLHEHVAARDREAAALGDDGRVVLACLSREVRLDPLQQPELTKALDLHLGSSMARRRRATASGSGASATARMTHARCNPSAVSCATFDSSIPPMAKTGTDDAAAIAAASSVPVFAIGGIDESNVAQLTAEGLHRACVIRAVAEAPDPEAVARRLRAMLLPK